MSYYKKAYRNMKQKLSIFHDLLKDYYAELQTGKALTLQIIPCFTNHA